MFNDNENLFQWDWQKAIKIAVLIIVSLYVLKAIYTVFAKNDDLQQINNMMRAQEEQDDTVLHVEYCNQQAYPSLY